MLSILIPVYNFDVTAFVAALVQQGRAIKLKFEIIVFDDGSTPEFLEKNREIQNFKEVEYQELPENLGRSKIRNRLAYSANYPFLLFMDGDSFPEHSDFIKKYIDGLDKNTVLVGGTSYEIAASDEYVLHWTIGRKREVHSVCHRSKKPYHSFTSNNFLIPRHLFIQSPFDENIREYGHEDTVFGLTLKKQNIPIKHIDNPLLHIGLEPAAVFLEKNKKALKNLILLSQKHDWMETKLLRSYRFLKQMRLLTLIKKIYPIIEDKVEKNLKGKCPSVLLFILYKIVWLDRYRSNQT